MKIFVKAKPNSKTEKVEKISENQFRVSVKEPPIKNRANQAVIKALAEYFRIPVSRITIIAGLTSKEKIVIIQMGSVANP